MKRGFSCKTCGEKFTSTGNLKRHSAIHDMSRSYPCSQCKFVSSRKDNLKRHYDLYHKQLYDDDSLEIVANAVAGGGHFGQQPHQLTEKKIMDNADDYFNSNCIDQRLQLPNNFIYAGATQSGKTTLLMKTLENASKIYNPVPSRIFFLYSCYQANYTTLKQNLASQGIECVFHNASVITEHELEGIADPNGGQTLIVIDDNSIAAASSKELAQVFTIARHKNCSMVLLQHFIFGPWPSSRIMSANTSYFFLLKSPRMLKQISTLGAQLQRQSALLSAYERETLKSYGCVLLDLCTATPEHMRLRTNIFDDSSGRRELKGPSNIKPLDVRHECLDSSAQTASIDENMTVETKDDDTNNTEKLTPFVFVPWDVEEKDEDAYVQMILEKRAKQL